MLQQRCTSPLLSSRPMWLIGLFSLQRAVKGQTWLHSFHCDIRGFTPLTFVLLITNIRNKLWRKLRHSFDKHYERRRIKLIKCQPERTAFISSSLPSHLSLFLHWLFFLQFTFSEFSWFNKAHIHCCCCNIVTNNTSEALMGGIQIADKREAEEDRLSNRKNTEVSHSCSLNDTLWKSLGCSEEADISAIPHTLI